MHNQNFVLRYRWLIISLTLIIVSASVIPLTQVSVNPDLESYLPASITPKVNTDKIGEIFGDNEMIILVFQSDDVLNPSTLTRIRNLSREFNRMHEFDDVMSLFDSKNIQNDYGMMVVNPVIKQIPESETDREALREEIRSNDLAYRLVVSEDFRYTLIILYAKNHTTDDAGLIKLINQKLKDFPGSEKVTINGQPYMRYEANQKIGRDILLLLPIGLVVMFIFLWLSFKEKRGVLLPFSVVIFSIIISMALIPLFGWELSIIGVLIPIMMIAIANNYGVYFITKYQELNASQSGITMKQIAVESYKYLKNPVMLCGLTTIAGVLGLVVHILLPARQMGVVSGIAIGFALLLSLFYIPAVMSMLKKGKAHKSFTGQRNGPVDKFLNAMAEFASYHPRQVVLVFSALLVLTVSGLFRFKVASDNNGILPVHHPMNVSLDILNKHFGGNKMINVLFEGDIKDPALLKNLDRYEKELEKTTGVGSVTSIATIIRKISTALNDKGDTLYDKIPDTPEAVAQYIELYSMSGDPEDFESIVNFEYTQALLTVQYQADNMEEINNIVNKINALTKDDPNKSLIGGYSLVDKEICESVVTGQFKSLLFAFVAILVMLTVIFRSLVAGLVGSLPLVFAVLCTFGIMGWTGIELNIVTALLSSVSIGLGVDFTIQMFWKLKTEIANGHSYTSAITIALKTMGRGISINALSVMLGFSVLFLSAFPLIRSFGFLIILSLFLCLICALVLIPSLCLLIKPKFLGPYRAETLEDEKIINT
ncbi:MAG: RND family transporter [Bacteroidales bacterium]|nr:RND family transporter [Bacteroidales bacterium]